MNDVAQRVRKPNIRRIFVPDPGYLLVDCDLKGADAVVVAWESEEPEFKRKLKTGIKIHKETALGFFGEKFNSAAGDTGNKLTPKGKMYDDIKRATHGTNYGASGRTLAANLGWTRDEGERFRYWWLRVQHPGIGLWHARTEQSLRTTRGVRNQFGYSVIYYDRIDGLLPEALAWQPQSTVALVSFMSALAVRQTYGALAPSKPGPVQFLAQVHDSIVFQIPWNTRIILSHLRKILDVTVPYPDPLIIGSKMQVSLRSWGDLIEVPDVITHEFWDLVKEKSHE